MALLIIVAVLFLFGCETFHGFGKDVEKAGEWVQEKAN
jgi:predicted small secreted protein